MTPPAWVRALADAFWAAAGGPEPFPRTLDAVRAGGPFDLAVKDVAGLTVRDVESYLARLDFAWRYVGRDRPLRACLAAWDGTAFLFLDAADAPAERTFSLAHELAHFLRHYWEPRRQACRRLGERVAEVFDGKRPPTPTERLHALLAGIRLGFYVHLMERGPGQGAVAGAVATAEAEADLLAYELLAPAQVVRARTEARSDGAPAPVAEILREGFGLPAAQADAYARLLCPSRSEDPLLRRLRKKT